MSKENEIEVTEVVQEQMPLSIGGTLSSAREKKNLSTSDVATALKLHEEYIVALESENFAILPAAPYARVYLKTYADYLEVDSHTLLALFDGKEVTPLGDDRENRDTIQIKIQEERPKNHWGFVVLAVVFVVVLLLLVQKQEPVIESETTISDTTETMEEPFDSSAMNIPILEGEKIETGDTLGSNDSVSSSSAQWDLDISIVTDSTWVHIVEDGKTVRNGLVKAPETIHLSVDDSVNMKIGKIQNIKVTREGKELPVEGHNMRALRITEEKVQVIPSRVWDSNFE